MDEALRGGTPVFDWMHCKPDGRLIPTEVRLVRLPGEGRNLLCATIIDNSERIRREQALSQRSKQMQKHRNVLLELARSDKSDLDRALLNVCALSATTLDVARVGYWSMQGKDGGILCELLYLRDKQRPDDGFRGTRLRAGDCPAYFDALAARLPIVANDALTHPATCGLAERYLKPTGINSMLDAPVWVRGEVVGVLCHEHTGPAREWSAEEIDFVSALAAMVSLAIEESNRARSESALRESEEKFRALFEASSQGVLLHDEHQYLEVNPAVARILGYDNPAELIGLHPRMTSPPVQPDGQDTAALANRYIEECLTKGHVRFEWMARRKSGEDVPVEVILTRIQLGGKRIIQAAINDISERKRAEAELLKSLEREKELGRLKSNFVSMVSHEFRTPLGIIQSSAEILKDYFSQLDEAERAEQLTSITRNTRRMAGMMDEILVLSRLDAGRLESRPEAMDLDAFCRRIVEEVHAATERRCNIELSLADVPPRAKADERLLEHIFTNLLTNAVKYSESGGKVSFTIEPDDCDAVCTVRDHGIGIPEADQLWLFQAFQRGGNVGDRPGTGLGLVIVKRCVELHGGQIQINSKPGEGTKVTVRLPLFQTT
ncbi:MAG TPA: ATP-binding protein [Verrucomicrobiota bacterium]|nr:ATP-binding protein [Verrucomicrobiota bacterium]